MLVYFNEHYNPTSFSASSYSTVAVLKISCLQEFFDSLSEMEFGNCFMIYGGWFDDERMESRLSLGFLYGLEVPFPRFTVTSRKSTSLRFV